MAQDPPVPIPPHLLRVSPSSVPVQHPTTTYSPHINPFLMHQSATL